MLEVIHVGLGAIGRSTVSALLDRPQVAKLCAVVDSNPELHGRDLAAVLNRPTPTRIPIVATIAAARQLDGQATVAIMTTGSRIPDVRGTLEQLADAGLHVVSSCEEMAFPTLRYPAEAAQLDRYAKSKKVAFLGTGVNPGFAMDAFALTVSAAVSRVKSIRCVRSLDARHRRYQLQKKVAAGMTLEAFKEGVAAKKIGHVGCAESAALLAAGLGWKLDHVDERFAPVIAETPIASEHFQIAAGQIRGMRMTAVGTAAGRTVIELDLTMAFDAPTFDLIQIDAERRIEVKVTTGFPGDTATVAMMINCASAMHRLEPGMRTMLDVMPVHAVGT